MDKCVICDEHVRINKNGKEDLVINLGQKAIASLTEKSVKLKDHKWRKWVKKTGLKVHKGCLQQYKNLNTVVPSRILQPVTLPGLSVNDDAYTYEDDDVFDFEKNCVLCGTEWDRETGHTVDRTYMSNKLLNMIKNLKGHDDLKKRTSEVLSLVDNKARYHQNCYESIFVLVPDENAKFQEKFDSVCKYLEDHKGETVTLSTLKKIMGDQYTESRLLQRKLKDKYGDDFHFWSERGKESLYFYKRNYLIDSCSDWMIDDSNLGQEQQCLILSTAANILRKKIMDKKYECDSYNAPGKFLSTVDDEIPKELSHFLTALVYPDERKNYYLNKITYIAHSIIRLIKPKSFISHLQLALSTYILRKTGSKLVIDILANLGICSSYYDTTLFEASCVMNPPEFNTGDSQIQFVYDNTDHNTQTLSGKDTYHCMGGIAIYTPEQEVTCEGKIKKCKTMPTEEEIVSVNTITTSYLPASFRDGLSKIEYVDTDIFKYETPDPLPPSYCAFLWGHYYGVKNMPSWKGYMEILSREHSYYVSRIICMPFIKLKPTEPTTIFTALVHALEETKKKKQKTCFVTFDQPLYIKARNIKEGMRDHGMDNVVVLLGMFHLIMSYMGTIGYLMEGSGLADMFGVVYGEKAVEKLLTGHIFDRAMRAHTLAFIALGKIICATAVENNGDIRDPIINFFKDWETDPPLLGDCKVDMNIQRSRKMFLDQLEIFKTNGPTAQLWAQYFESLVILFQFYESSRLGNWDLFLQSIQQMLPFFHAANHFHYAKCAQIFLQDMENLKNSMDPVEYHQFTNESMFTIRRSDKAFAGIWADMTIEQTLNRFFGTDLVHGRGVTDGVVARYLNSMPSSYEVMNVLEEYTGVNTRRSEQHKDSTRSRINIDQKDVEKFVFWLNTHQPFTPRQTLMSLSTGAIGTPNINCHLAVIMGKKAMKKMIGKNAEQVKLSKQDGVKNLSHAVSILHHAEDTSATDHMARKKYSS
ncbi:uncharacterized protein LOC122849544 [Aphidius gifuensis]|uniref:uncharacterized protein LOC122849544 n=1 Tax=Aphidius gifuensis TaxID=684658 RepID=UPI001CDC684C|nr:uncharacterized protein LOC122849544 [Aphidius gifuensis]